MKTNIFKKTFQNFCLKKNLEIISLLHYTESWCKLVIFRTGHLPDWSSPDDPARVLAAVAYGVGRLNPCSIKIVQQCNMWYTQFAKWHKNIINENLLWPPLSSGEFYNLLHFDHHNHGALCHNARRPKLHTLCWYHHDDLDHNIASYAWFYV